MLLPPRAPPPRHSVPSPASGGERRSGGRRKRAVAAAAAGDLPGSPLLHAGLGEGIRHIGAAAEGVSQPRHEPCGGGGPGEDLGGVGCSGARKAGE